MTTANLETDAQAIISIFTVAAICHEANRRYCQQQGDESQVPWEEAPDWQRESAEKGVRFCLDNPDAPPSANHESWLKQKEDEGWKYGAVKNPETKEHPCFVPYSELPAEQKAKDYLFKGIVDGLRPFTAIPSAVEAATTNG